MTKIRGFEVVSESFRTAFETWTDENKAKHTFATEITLPTRADVASAGYDFYLPKDVILLPAQKTLIFTDVKAYMQPDEVLQLFIRSSLAIKQGLMLPNNVGIIDASYYSNPGNDGNIGIALVNTSGISVKLRKGDRVIQGIFTKFFVADVDETAKTERTGGFGSSGE